MPISLLIGVRQAESDAAADVTRFLQQVQAEEIKLLLAYSYQNAV